MSWPLASHFSAMLQNPKVAFRDPELQKYRIEKDARNQPKPWSGAFAVVYKGVAGDGRAYALRVFTTESPERRERYDRISEYLRTHKVACLVDFEYRDRSIRSAGDGKWYPLILMDWVQGDTLFKWVRARALEENREALAEAAQRWEALVRELADVQIAHGDLQHANVMVTRAGELKLVDYDCLCVPALVGRRNLEVGVEPYQHPDRNHETPLSLDLDNFSALVIYVALRAVAADPWLWTKYVEASTYDKLLFRKEDFQTSATSPLFHDLARSPEQEVRDLARQLFDLSRTRMEQVPSLSQLVNSFGRIEQLLVTEQWQAAVHLLNRRGKFRDAPVRLKPLIHKAYEHVCREQAWAAFQAIDPAIDERHDRERIKTWNETLFAGFEPAEKCRAEVMEARKRVAAVDELARLVKRAGPRGTIRQEWEIFSVASQLPRKYPYALRRRVRKARLAVIAVRAIERAVRLLDDDAEIVAAWERVQKYQCAELVNPERLPRVELAFKRLPCIQALRTLSPELPPDQVDRRLLDIWEERLLAGCREASVWRARYELALQRQEMLKRLEEALRERQEWVIAELVSDSRLANYPLPPSWIPVIRTFQERVNKIEALLMALREEDRPAFTAGFDVRLIRHHEERFRPYEALVNQWTRSDILPLENLGLGPFLGQESLICVDKGERLFQVRWNWPQPRFAGECLLGICPHEPRIEEDPLELELWCRVPVDRQSWESAGGSRSLCVRREWMGGWVVVWATVDLGFRLFYSPPLVLGRLWDASGSSRGLWRKAFGWMRGREKRPLSAVGGKTLEHPADCPDRRSH